MDCAICTRLVISSAIQLRIGAPPRQRPLNGYFYDEIERYMSDQRQSNTSCGCDNSRPASTATPAVGEAITKHVKTQVQQDVQSNFNLRIVPARSLDRLTKTPPQCQPREHAAHGWTAGQFVVDAALVSTLAKGDKALMTWLAKDRSHAQKFLASPVAAMAEAGVALTRSQEKSLVRSSEEAAAARTVKNGENGVSMVTQVFPKGRVGSIGTHKPDGDTDDFGCGPKVKG